MKRMHLHVGVEDLDASISFYTHLFAAEPTVRKDDYAKWMLDDPHINFAITPTSHTAQGIEHIGLQVETAEELEEVRQRLAGAGRPVLTEAATQCCYAQSSKNWVTDPDGIIWETFLTSGDHVDYGNKDPIATGMAKLAALENRRADETTAGSCCVPSAAANGTAI